MFIMKLIRNFQEEIQQILNSLKLN